jgi:DDE superfamily endonuclease
MSSFSSRLSTLLDDSRNSMVKAIVAAAAGNFVVAYEVVSALHQRQTAWTQLPAHHQPRRMMDDLGFLSLGRVDVPFSDLASPSSGLAFVDDELDPIPDDTIYARLCRRPSSDFYEHTRLTCTEFLILYQELRPFIARPRDSDFSVAYAESDLSRYSHRKLHPIDELLLWLYHADGNKHTVLCLLFDIDRTSVNVITDHVTRAMNHVWGEEVQWPSKEEREQLHGFFSCHQKAVGCIDGTHCRIDVPDSEEEEESNYSGYKHYHTQNYLLCCDAFGFIIYIAGPFDGSWNDKQCFLASDFMDPEQKMLEPDERLITDGGFSGFAMNVHPYSAVDMKDVSDEDKALMVAFNEEIVLNRSLNEHVNHQVRARV